MEQLEKERLASLPYGQWHTEGGALVVFDRQHRPIFRCDDKGAVELMHGDEWIEGIVEAKTQYFYQDSKGPDQDFHTLAKVKKVMADYFMIYRQQQVSQLPLPKQSKSEKGGR